MVLIFLSKKLDHVGRFSQRQMVRNGLKVDGSFQF